MNFTKSLLLGMIHVKYMYSLSYQLTQLTLHKPSHLNNLLFV